MKHYLDLTIEPTVLRGTSPEEAFDIWSGGLTDASEKERSEGYRSERDALAESEWGGQANMPAELQRENFDSSKKQLGAMKRYLGDERMAELEEGPSAADIFGEAVDLAFETAPKIDQAYQDAFGSLLPTWRQDIIGSSREALSKVQTIASQFITGELPDDVAAYIERTRAEKNISQGLFGEIDRYATTRDLGLTSLDMVQKGVDIYADKVPGLVGNLGSSVQSFMPGTSNMLSLIDKGIGVSTFTAQNLWERELSAFNAEMDIWQTEIQKDMNEAAIDASLTQSYVAAGADITGSIIGMFGSKEEGP